MAAETVVIDIVTNFKDSAGSGFEREKKSVDDYEKSIEKLKSQIKKLTNDRAVAKVDVEDKATSKLNKISSFLKGMKDKAISFPIKAIDKATAPIKSITNKIFSLKTLIAGIASGVAIKKTILDPIGLADSYSGAKIGFSTLLGESGGQQLMDQLDQFAKATPFKTSNTIQQAQRMIAMGWDAENIVADMTTIGDAAAATGKGDEGLQRIVTALAQIKSKGKLSTEELNQLAEAGISAKRYLAEGLGYGSGDAGIMKLSEDLQKGAIGSEQAIQALMKGMKEYQGMMDQTANETVEGLKSQIEDTFEINIFRRWGQGLQEGAKKGLGSIVELLDKSEAGLQKVGDFLEELGSDLSNLAADKLESVINKIMEVSDSTEFQNADLFGKAKIMWDEVIAEPFGSWWDSTGQPYFVEKMGNLGEGLGSGLSNIIKGLLGFNDEAGDIADDAVTMGGSFAKGFLEGFDGAGIWKALKECISNAFSDAFKAITGSGDGSSYLSAALLGYLGIKGGKAILGGANGILGLLGKQSVGSMLLGSAGAGTGILGFGANTAIGLGAGNLAGGASLGAGALSALGLGSVAGGALGAGTLISGFADLYRGAKHEDKAGQAAYGKSAGKKIFGVGGGALAGAAIGSVVPVIGTAAGALIGAGVGGIAGWISGKKDIDEYNKSLEETKEKAAEAEAALKEAASKDIADHFGNISLSMEEIATLADKIVGGSSEKLNKFSDAAKTADSSLQNLQTAYSSIEKMNWKAGLGFELSSDEQESYKSSIDNYISSAKQYVEDKQYEFTAAVSLLMDVKDGSAGSEILSGGNAIYEKMQKDLDTYGGKLEKEVDIALKDGKIEADEQKIISDYQSKIKEITDKLSSSETEAKMEALKIKFSGADMDYDSFSKLQQQLQSVLEERTASYDEALAIDIANLKLQFPDGGAEYDAALKELTDSYHAKIDEMNVEVQGFQFDTLAESYGAELDKALADSNFAGTTAEKISQAMQQAMSEGVDVASWDAETCKKYLGLDGMEDASVEAISQITASIAQTLPDQMSTSLSGLSSESVSGPIKNMLETGVNDGINAAEFNFSPDLISDRFGLSLENTSFPALQTSTKTGIENAVKAGAESTSISGDFGVPGKVDSGLSAGMTSDKFSGTGSKAVSSASSAIQSAFNGASVDASIGVNLTPNISLTKTSATITASGGATGSGTAKFSVAQNAAGGYVGGKQLSWLAEEGYGEYVIPTDPKRRSRALKLWEQAGETLGIKKHASGGIVGSMLPKSGGKQKESDSGSSKGIEVNVGGVTIQLSGGDGNVISQLNNNKKKITSMISEMLNEAIEEAFESLPLSAN